MVLETGDIIISLNLDSWYGPLDPGHALMCYSGGDEGDKKTMLVHGNGVNNFHIIPQLHEKNGMYSYTYASSQHWLFRPPWHLVPGHLLDTERQRFKKIIDEMIRGTEWTKQRAFSSIWGTTTFDTAAREKLKKYKRRSQTVFNNATPPDGYIVKQITCAEAVILTYQITFEEDSPLFIKICAHHTWPRNLVSHLEELSQKQGSGWRMKRPQDNDFLPN